MELTIPNRRFVCIDYPGDIINTDKAVETLGGIKQIYKTFKDANVRMKLNFRHEDFYCKSSYGDRVPRISVLLKIKMKKNIDGTNGTGELEGEIIGTISAAYTFSALSDFQFLAVEKERNGYASHVDQLLVGQLQPRDWLSKPAHPFLLPPIFSRFDQPVQYCYRNNAGFKNFQFPDNCIGISRNRRPHFTMFFKFSSPTVPSKPHEESLKKIQRTAVPSWKIEKVKEKFETQNIWSTIALLAEVGPSVNRDDLKLILPSIAFHCIDGPWRAMWVKLGYDMRTDPSSKIYQNLDSRQEKRMSSLCSNKIPAKRSTFNYHLPNTIMRAQSTQPTSVQPSSTSKQISCEETDFKHSLESCYKFRPGLAPKYRQIFYHLYNIEESEVQKLVHMNNGQETECTEKDGWCLPDTIEKCRAIINSYRNKKTGDFGNEPQQEPTDEVDLEEIEDEEEEEVEKHGYEEDDEYDEEDGGDGIYEGQDASIEDLLNQDSFTKIMNILPQDEGNKE